MPKRRSWRFQARNKRSKRSLCRIWSTYKYPYRTDRGCFASERHWVFRRTWCTWRGQPKRLLAPLLHYLSRFDNNPVTPVPSASRSLRHLNSQPSWRANLHRPLLGSVPDRHKTALNKSAFTIDDDHGSGTEAFAHEIEIGFRKILRLPDSANRQRSPARLLSCFSQKSLLPASEIFHFNLPRTGQGFPRNGPLKAAPAPI